MDGVKEDNPMNNDPLLDRGIAVLSVDGPGQGETRERGITCTASNYADVGKLVCDYLVKRAEIDANRLAVMGSSMGSYWAPRVVAAEPRFKACAVSGVCMEPGQYAIFNMSSPTFKLNYMYMAGYDDEAAFDEFAKTLTLKGITSKISCPYMVVAGEDDEHCDMKFVYELMGEIPGPKLLVVYEGERHSIRNPNSRPKMINWLTDRLAGKPFTSEIIRAETSGKEVHSVVKGRGSRLEDGNDHDPPSSIFHFRAGRMRSLRHLIGGVSGDMFVAALLDLDCLRNAPKRSSRKSTSSSTSVEEDCFIDSRIAFHVVCPKQESPGLRDIRQNFSAADSLPRSKRSAPIFFAAWPKLKQRSTALPWIEFIFTKLARRIPSWTSWPRPSAATI
jgi:dienelactone hydrolase